MSGMFETMGGIGTGTKAGSVPRAGEIDRAGRLRLGGSMPRSRIQRRT